MIVKFFHINLLVALILLPLCYSSLIGIDFGDSTFKVSLVKPKTLDIVLNEASARKTPSLLAYYNGEILVGQEAKNLVNIERIRL
jgi:molecular chaperone DnaK (HSP70)